MRYKCQFCDFETNTRSRIHVHHIKPKQAGGSNNKGNLVYLCPTHHAMIYSEYSKKGIHAVKDEQSIQLTKWYFSTGGWVLGYLDKDGNEQFIGFNKN